VSRRWSDADIQYCWFTTQVSVEADTWEEAVASLSYDDWDDNCHEKSDDIWERRVFHVYNQDNDIVAEDLAFDCAAVLSPAGHT
jgi:hypothetical protein